MRKIVTTVNPQLGDFEPGFMALVSPKGEKKIINFTLEHDLFEFGSNGYYTITKLISEDYNQCKIVFTSEYSEGGMNFKYRPPNVRVVEVDNRAVTLVPSIAEKAIKSIKSLGNKLAKLKFTN